MTNFICIENTGYGADEFTIGSGGEFVPSRDEMYANTSMPMCWAGFFKPQWLEICKKHNLRVCIGRKSHFLNRIQYIEKQ